MPSPRNEFLSGIKADLPILVGVIPFGLIYGVLALDAGLAPGEALAMSAIVFAGSAQFIAAQLFGTGTPALVIILTIAIVNLRHALYSASIAPHVKKLTSSWKWGLAYLLTDEAYAVSITHYQEDKYPQSSDTHPDDHKHWFFLGAGLTLWITWQLSTAVGIFIGAQVPESWSLDFTLALTFIALVVPLLKDRASLGAALAAGLMAVLAFTLPYKLGLVTAALVGILVGLWIEAKS
ncbi:MAG: AzlC family ABC transporter permease [Anaerolineales bacterium]|nr:AzlC family ABC transporter permease [Anaerolineales bacterium]MCK5316069.1 AzlC family ABC transporter permease [Anaerolineales bacterium]MCK5429659.1 AzlC family ABC transporter permease [Anaerolineales bacterium]